MRAFPNTSAAQAVEASMRGRTAGKTFLLLAGLSLGFCLAVGLSEPLSGSLEKPSLAKKAEEGKDAGSLTLVNESGAVTTLSPQDFAKLPRQTVRAKDHSGAFATYEGVSLAKVLQAAKVALGKDLKGPLLAHCLLVEAADGYRVVFSLPEVDPSMTDNLVLLADRKDAKPLDTKEAPYRLVVPHDKRYSRWVRQVTRISVQATTDLRTRSKEK
jgi:hypothetical protein